MAFLFITPKEISTTTVLGGNVDIDKYQFIIESVQVSVIEPLLGTELYDKVRTEAEAATITGDYLTLYTEFVKPITKNEALAEYIEVATLMVTNAGIFKNAPENTESPTTSEVQVLADKYHGLGQLYAQRFEKWMSKRNIPEYKAYQDEVNAQAIKTQTGWYL